MSAFASASGPVIGGLVLAWGIDHGAVGLVWWTWMFLVALTALGWSFVLKKTDDEDAEKGTLEGE